LSAELTKMHSFRLFFWWFFPLGRNKEVWIPGWFF